MNNEIDGNTQINSIHAFFNLHVKSFRSKFLKEESV